MRRFDRRTVAGALAPRYTEARPVVGMGRAGEIDRRKLAQRAMAAAGAQSRVVRRMTDAERIGRRAEARALDLLRALLRLIPMRGDGRQRELRNKKQARQGANRGGKTKTMARAAAAAPDEGAAVRGLKKE